MSDQPKISLEDIKKIPPKLLLRMINNAKKFLKTDSAMLEACKKHNVDIESIDYIPTYFADLEVSAKTEKGIVYLNYALLCDGDFLKDYGYLTHEYVHVLQQCYGDGPTQGSDDGNYLDNPMEQESFQYQVEFLSDHFGEDEAEEYVDDLLDHHEVPKKEKEEKKEILMAKASDINIKKLIKDSADSNDDWQVLVDYLLENNKIPELSILDLAIYLNKYFKRVKVYYIYVGNILKKENSSSKLDQTPYTRVNKVKENGEKTIIYCNDGSKRELFYNDEIAVLDFENKFSSLWV